MDRINQYYIQLWIIYKLYKEFFEFYCNNKAKKLDILIQLIYISIFIIKEIDIIYF